MKNSFFKALVLMLALMLTLTGCNLIEIDADMQADEDIAKLREKYGATVASWDGGAITSADVLSVFDSSYGEMNYMYMYYMGIEMGDDEARAMIEDTLSERVRNEITAAHFDAENELTQEELDEVEANVGAEFEEVRKMAYDSAEGKTEKQKNANVRVMLCEVGREYDTDYKTHLLETKVEKMKGILTDSVADLTEEELQEAYAQHVADAEAIYSSDISSFENDISSGATIYWTPDGYRTVKHILVIPQSDLMDAYTSAKTSVENDETNIELLEGELEAFDAETAEGRTEDDIRSELEAAQTQLATDTEALEGAKQACLEDVKADTDAIYAALEGGMSFEDAIAQYGQDPGMQNEPTATTGYYVSDISTCWQEEFTEGAMALNQVGEYSAEPVLSGSGVHIIEYASDVAGGEAGLDNVREVLHDEALTEKQESYVTDTINAWVEEQHPVYDVEAFHKAYFG